MTSLKPPLSSNNHNNNAALTSSPTPTPTLAPQPQPLSLTIRFSASIPDLDLEIPHPSQTTVVSLKHLIRGRLAEPNSQRRLRFIQGGRILPDTAALSSVLRAPPPAPPSRYDEYNEVLTSTAAPATVTGSHHDAKGKGKGVPNRPPPPQRIYINCSIGDSLTTSELEAEAKAAAVPVAPPSSPLLRPTTTTSPAAGAAPGSGTTTTTGGTINNNQNQNQNTPRGFDRLLHAGFTPAEVNQLRLQFRSIHASRYTPDTLPSPDSFRRMEDSWIDDNGAAAMPTTASSTGGGLEGNDDGGNNSGLAGHLDALVWGVVTGFMWPLGSFGWLVRQHGIHSDRWRFMVCVGVLFSFLIGIVRSISGGK